MQMRFHDSESGLAVSMCDGRLVEQSRWEEGEESQTWTRRQVMDRLFASGSDNRQRRAQSQNAALVRSVICVDRWVLGPRSWIWVAGYWLLTESEAVLKAVIMPPRFAPRFGRQGDMSRYIDQQESRTLVHDESIF